MAVIYSASADSNSANTASRFIAPLLRWLWPELEGASLAAAVLAVRKLAHVTEYAILAILVLWAVRRIGKVGAAWSWRHTQLTLAIVAAYAASDEIHQTFVPTRQGTVTDVLIDTAGGALGLALAYFLSRLSGRSRIKTVKPRKSRQPVEQLD
jgi:VanZ family protein